MIETIEPPEAAPVAVEELRSHLRIDAACDDAALAGAIRSATALCEAFVGGPLLLRTLRETFAAAQAWQPLSQMPARTIDQVCAIDADGSERILPSMAYAIDIDAQGQGWVRLTTRDAARRMAVRYSAGIAGDWNGVPEPIRQGIVRLAGHLHGDSDAAPPAAVTALWRPWRRMRLRATEARA